MKQLQGLSTKTDYKFVVDHCVGRPPSVALSGPGVATYFLSVPETELLKLIKGLQERCDKLEAVMKHQPDKADAVVQVGGDSVPTLFGYKMKPTWPSEAGEAAADLAEGVICYVSDCLAGGSWHDLSQTRRESILRGLAHLIHRATTK